ncbi:putative bifunctional diguanylate cyclase/phosphodiesterase [Stutzerimonas kirkiae]|uniref:putative bifunctional diguanylate cyclase/phosphodiesterase n=1 Tax=Stutzerimonas kirkiae TaxID=2211392 RepID=UPI0010384256|nr:EAL domain-containing protein [Stutzerimonas kirkiae]TBV12401.1 hypothetical protein DNK08_00820 [Stutzerimonas kirkiae]TBV12588.1 hypothetical protein DNK01_14205 [Stutzerimonas kirkiae]
MKNELKALLERVSLKAEDIQVRKRLLQWRTADAKRLNQAAGSLDEVHAHFIDRLYEHLARFERPAQILDDPDGLERLKQSQKRYYQRLWMGPYDRDYVNDRLLVGLVHQRVGVDLEWYMGAYRLYLGEILEELLGDAPNSKLYGSLLKAVFFDMMLAIDTYSTAQRQALEDSEARLARALRGTEDGIWDWDINQDRLYLSERWTSMLGLPPQTTTSSDDWFSRVHPDDLPGLRGAISAHMNGLAPSFCHEYRIRTVRDDYTWVLARGVIEEGPQGPRMAGSQADISGRKRAEASLRHAARHDPLTGLANRMHLDELLKKVQTRVHSRDSALLFVDLDRFKLINDSLGHGTGDKVLIEVTARLRRCLRPGDHLARFGGDEFVALLGDLACEADAEGVARRMLDALRQPMLIDFHMLTISASIGIAPLYRDGQPLDALQAADLALYSAKGAGKDRFALYYDGLQHTAKRQLALESALAQALERNEYSLHYQPICQLVDGKPYLAGVEALLRWSDQGRLVPPQEFIPVLEASSGIVRVGEWVLQEACRQVRDWQLAGQAQMHCAVNLSIRQLQEHDFADRLMLILDETGLAPGSLVLEITETLLMQDSMLVRNNLQRIAGLGVRLALDDFGTGYCSLGYLKRFPLHILKVDRSFISGTPENAESLVISRAIIGLGQSLGLSVVAEGVEEQAQLDFLDAEHCPFVQGYWFSRPIPAAQLQEMFSESGAFNV